MASKSVYQEYNEDALNHFGLAGEPYFGFYQSNTISDVLITQDETTYLKILDLFQSSLTKPNLSNYKKAFILPKCPVSQDRIKAACKEHKITVTNDYTKADFIITHDDINQKFQNGDKILTSVIMYKLWNYEAFPGTEGYVNFIDDYYKRTGNSILWDDKTNELRNSYRLNNPESLYDEWVLPGLAVNLGFLVDTGELDVIDVDDLLCQSANKIPLTETLISEISNWISSYDSENKALAAKILPTIEFDKNLHLMWNLAQEINGQMYNFNRDKDVQYWIDASNLERFYHFSAQDMILYLEKEEKLNTESFRYLEPIVRKEIRINNRDLYVFKVHVKPEYRKFLKKQTNE